MNSVKIITLGTSAGSPSMERSVSATAVISPFAKDWYLIDCGEGTQQQVMKSPLTLSNLKGIFITHLHGDHLFGLPGILGSASFQGRTEALTIYAPQSVQEYIELTFKVSETHIRFPINYKIIEADTSQKWPMNDCLTITSHPLSHRLPCNAYQFDFSHKQIKLEHQKLKDNELPQGKLWQYLINDGEVVCDDRTYKLDDYSFIEENYVTVVIAGDNDTPELLTKACENTTALVHEATFDLARFKEIGLKYQHICGFHLASFAQAVKLENLILTHISARFNSKKGREQVIAEASGEYRGNLHLAEDLKAFEFELKKRTI
jgi:ribonuclease Z